MSVKAIDYTYVAVTDMERHFGVSDEFSIKFMPRFNRCMDKFGDDLMKLQQQKAWKGFFDYAASNGTSKDTRGKPDHWEDCVGAGDPDCAFSEFQETL